MANNTLDLGKVTIVEGEDLSVLEHVTYNSEKDQLDSDKPLVETMNGYSAQVTSDIKPLTREGIYLGAAKNGNKLTIACALNITRTDNFNSDVQLCGFTIPASVGAKLYPVQVGGYNQGLAYLKAIAMDNSSTIGKDMAILIEKESNTRINVYLEDYNVINQLALNTKYYIRIEATFLLSDNLIS